MSNPTGITCPKAKILTPTAENISVVAQAIREGQVVGMPTETVYGLAGNGRSAEALARIFDTKERPTFDPLILHVGLEAQSLEDLEKMNLVDASNFSKAVRDRIHFVITTFWPGPLTLVLPKHPSVPDLATSGLPSVALRMPEHPVAQALLSACQCPLAAPSANRFGRISPTTPEAVFEELGDRIPWILDGGPARIGVESTVITFTPEGQVRILRPGGTSKEALEQALGEPVLTSSTQEVLGPGMLESHYAPQKLLQLLPRRILDLTNEDFEQIQSFLEKNVCQGTIGLLMIQGDPTEGVRYFSKHIKNLVISRSLSPQGDLEESARNLFAEMRYLDSSEAVTLFSEPCLEAKGLGFAIQDRLKRASCGKTHPTNPLEKS